MLLVGLDQALLLIAAVFLICGGVICRQKFSVRAVDNSRCIISYNNNNGNNNSSDGIQQHGHNTPQVVAKRHFDTDITFATSCDHEAVFGDESFPRIDPAGAVVASTDCPVKQFVIQSAASVFEPATSASAAGIFFNIEHR